MKVVSDDISSSSSRRAQSLRLLRGAESIRTCRADARSEEADEDVTVPGMEGREGRLLLESDGVMRIRNVRVLLWRYFFLKVLRRLRTDDPVLLSELLSWPTLSQSVESSPAKTGVTGEEHGESSRASCQLATVALGIA
jgi:hypothetical protein